jgi:nucleoside 2-deoxyribosyltransferase
MTKYPDPKKPAVTDPQLNAVIQTVAAAVTAQQHVPRIASDKDYHSKIWDNVELHMLGCRRAIAIVQDKVKKEFNPNVAIEWGWMLALNRPVLYLVERKFKQQRADWQGMTEYEFDWADPAPGVDAAVAKFLAGGS